MFLNNPGVLITKDHFLQEVWRGCQSPKVEMGHPLLIFQVEMGHPLLIFHVLLLASLLLLGGHGHRMKICFCTPPGRAARRTTISTCFLHSTSQLPTQQR
jgi:hypothetical protein